MKAGLVPNPVKFANKFIANDGHKCDSLAEKIIDDWLNARHIHHEIHVRYQGTRFTSDFKIGNTFVEFFGLKGQLKKYNELMDQKLQLIREKKLKLIPIYPEDLFPPSKLDNILTNILRPGTKGETF